VVDQVPGPARLGHRELGGRRRDRGDGRAEEHSELHRRQPDPAAGAEDDEVVALADAGDGAQHVPGGAVGHAERGGSAVVHAVGDHQE
jgi:hypothetical protein